MKLILGLQIFAFAFIYVASEVCTVNDDCTVTACSSGATLFCQHPDGEGVTANGGLCTCLDSPAGGCTGPSDCYGDKAPSLSCSDNLRHCYDGNCICDRFPGGK